MEVQGMRCSPPNLPKGPLLTTKWAKNEVFVGGLRGWGSKSQFFESKRSTFFGGSPSPRSILDRFRKLWVQNLIPLCNQMCPECVTPMARRLELPYPGNCKCFWQHSKICSNMPSIIESESLDHITLPFLVPSQHAVSTCRYSRKVVQTWEYACVKDLSKFKRYTIRACHIRLLVDCYQNQDRRPTSALAKVFHIYTFPQVCTTSLQHFFSIDIWLDLASRQLLSSQPSSVV